MDGVVDTIFYSRGGGVVLVLEHGAGVRSRYMHLGRVLCLPYRRVRRGEAIAIMGQGGIATGVHLHFELRTPSGPLDPIPLIGL